MSKRISANMFVKNADGEFSVVPKVEVRRKDLMEMLNDPTAVPAEYADGAGDFELINFWFKPGSNDLKEVLVRFSGEITDAKTSLVNAVFDGNPAKDVLVIRTFRPYRPLNKYQVQVQKLLDSLIVVEDVPTRAGLVEEVRGLLVELGMDPVEAFANSDLYPKMAEKVEKASDTPESVEISGTISVEESDAMADALGDIADVDEDVDEDEKVNIAAGYAEAKGRSI